MSIELVNKLREVATLTPDERLEKCGQFKDKLATTSPISDPDDYYRAVENRKIFSLSDQEIIDGLLMLEAPELNPNNFDYARYCQSVLTYKNNTDEVVE